MMAREEAGQLCNSEDAGLEAAREFTGSEERTALRAGAGALSTWFEALPGGVWGR
jgi:hypothetical protein